MPPKAKITKEMILNTVLEITKEKGFEAVNARSIAEQLQCSTRPIFTCYKNMDELKEDFLAFAYGYYEQYTADYRNFADAEPYLILPLSYIAFAREETNVFRLLFVDDMDLEMTAERDFYKESGNEKKVREFAEAVGIELERAKVIFFDLFLYSHGMAVLTAAGKIALDRETVEKMLANVLAAFIRRKNIGYGDAV